MSKEIKDLRRAAEEAARDLERGTRLLLQYDELVKHAKKRQLKRAAAYACAVAALRAAEDDLASHTPAYQQTKRSLFRLLSR